MNDRKIINYEDCFVAFLDVLGFKALVKKSDDTSRLDKYFNIVESAIKEDIEGHYDKTDIDSIIISDSIILRIKQKEGDITFNIEQLRKLCIVVAKMQLRLAYEDIWIRGGIASGKVHFDTENNQVVGPAFIQAYYLEEELAKNPRVILDNKIINELNFRSADELIETMVATKNIVNDYYGKNILFKWNSNMKLKKDIPLFVDYATILATNTTVLDKVIDNVAKNIYADTTLYTKYKWVAEYIEAVCERDEIIGANCIQKVNAL